jgi:ABC-type Mn2+/Zn2+ transport system ATPase subunit
MCNCTSGNLEIPGSLASLAPRNDDLNWENTPDMDAITPTAVALKNVARRFVTPTGEILSALEDFDLTIAPGEFFAIVGPTGCGKSTTLGLIAGLAKPQAGEVTLFDAPVDGVDRRVGFVFQHTISTRRSCSPTGWRC